MFIFERETERESVSRGEAEGDRIWSRLQVWAVSTQPNAELEFKPRDHDLSQSWIPNCPSHPGAPHPNFWWASRHEMHAWFFRQYMAQSGGMAKHYITEALLPLNSKALIVREKLVFSEWVFCSFSLCSQRRTVSLWFWEKNKIERGTLCPLVGTYTDLWDNPNSTG